MKSIIIRVLIIVLYILLVSFILGLQKGIEVLIKLPWNFITFYICVERNHNIMYFYALETLKSLEKLLYLYFLFFLTLNMYERLMINKIYFLSKNLTI
jgi:hypothetical protein